MGYAGKRLTVFSVIVLFLMSCAVAGAAQTQTPGEAVSSGSALQEQFHKARESFLKKEFHDAASEIQQAVTFLEMGEGGEAKRVFEEIARRYPGHYQTKRAADYLRHMEARAGRAD